MFPVSYIKVSQAWEQILDDEFDYGEVSNRVFEITKAFVDEGIPYPMICIALVTHAARLGIQLDDEPRDVVANLLMPIICQLLDPTNFSESSSDEEDSLRNLTTPSTLIH